MKRRREQQQQPKQLIKDPQRDSLKDFPNHPHREDLSSHSKREEEIDTNNHSRNDSKKEQRTDLDKQQKPSKNQHKKGLKPKKLRADIDSALGSGGSSFIKRLCESMLHTTKRKQPSHMRSQHQTSPQAPRSSVQGPCGSHLKSRVSLSVSLGSCATTRCLSMRNPITNQGVTYTIPRAGLPIVWRRQRPSRS
ncbi:Hypothetical predicted protein [Drosophila guanche]|uniref:Uncharacterized protein n=1 Tax=Drosophila guanche TaxID=7266 RepID=A0A3B0KLV2_DROGU|nr:Hypothetical predicted protein [Drosophila guanche]